VIVHERAALPVLTGLHPVSSNVRLSNSWPTTPQNPKNKAITSDRLREPSARRLARPTKLRIDSSSRRNYAHRSGRRRQFPERELGIATVMDIQPRHRRQSGIEDRWSISPSYLNRSRVELSDSIYRDRHRDWVLSGQNVVHMFSTLALWNVVLTRTVCPASVARSACHRSCHWPWVSFARSHAATQ
jgi:hypothetical protein